MPEIAAKSVILFLTNGEKIEHEIINVWNLDSNLIGFELVKPIQVGSKKCNLIAYQADTIQNLFYEDFHTIEKKEKEKKDFFEQLARQSFQSL